MLFHNIFAGLRSLCSVRNAHSPHCVTAVACPPHMSPYKRDLPQGSPPAPRFCVSGQTKNVVSQHFCRAPFLVLRAQCALTALRHSSRLSAAHVAVQAGFAAGVSPAPRFCVSGQTKNVVSQHFCRAPFLVLRAQCALTALLFCLKAYLSSRSGRRSLVISNAFFARQASTSWWLPETSTSGTDSPLYTCGRV